MKNDPIVAEVRSIRDELAAQCGYDLKEIFRQIWEQQAESGLKYVRYPAHRVAPTEDMRAPNAARKTG